MSATPVASFPVAQRQCFDEPEVYQQRPSGAGALIGAIAGAAIGSNIGSSGNIGIGSRYTFTIFYVATSRNYI
jgi:hypothetical protein